MVCLVVVVLEYESESQQKRNPNYLVHWLRAAVRGLCFEIWGTPLVCVFGGCCFVWEIEMEIYWYLCAGLILYVSVEFKNIFVR